MPSRFADQQQQRDDDHGVEEVAAVVGEGSAAGHGESAVFLDKLDVGADVRNVGLRGEGADRSYANTAN